MSDGSSWSVLPDWEASKGMKNDNMLVTDSPGAPKHHLEELFQGDIFFSPIVRHLLGKSTGDSVSERKRAMHRSEGFAIENDKLWRISTKTSDRVARTECRPSTSGFQLALETHERNGHFSADLVKLKLRDHFFWPGLDVDCRQACLECPHCKNFGPTTMTALLQPI